MPKKTYKPQTPKPKPQSPTSAQASSASHGSQDRSVNDLIQHLRHTQVSGSQKRGNGWKVTPRSVHPSLRNLLELPETPPPRPRHGHSAHQIGGRRIRRTPGPSAPASWLSPSQQPEETSQDRTKVEDEGHGSRLRLRLDRLPEAAFPPRNSLLHMILKSMAVQWDWHLVYDGIFLSELPTHLKLLLLSYIAVYTEHAMMGVQMRGLKPLFMADDNAESATGPDEYPEVNRLDFGGAIGHWINLKQLGRELKYETPHSKVPVSTPTSWEEEAEASYSSSTTFAPSQPLRLRFPNLQYLSLAHPAPSAANWASLLNLLSHLATLTHLSLAHWPIPTFKPNSLSARVRHPKIKSLSFSYGGTDVYSSYENNWSEAATILAKLSRSTYCLKWLDLEGCSEWIPALCWNGVDVYGGVHPTSGPEWNGSWRGIEWLGIGPGWSPESVEEVKDAEEGDGPSSSRGIQGSERMEEHRRLKRRQAYSKCIDVAKDVQRQVRKIRTEGGGRWLDVEVGTKVSEA